MPFGVHFGDYIPCCHEVPSPPPEAYDERIIVRTRVTNQPAAFEDFKEYRGVLSFISPQFRIMLDSLIRTPIGFEVDGHPVVDLGVTNNTWHLFRDWMFRGGNVTTNVGDSLDKLTLESAESRKSLIMLYAIAEKNEITELQNVVLGLYFTRCTYVWAEFWRDGHVVYAYSKKDSPLRKLYLEMLVDFWKFDELESALDILDDKVQDDYLEACSRRHVVPGRYEQDPVWLPRGHKYKWIPCPRLIHTTLWKDGFCDAFHAHLGQPIDYAQGENRDTHLEAGGWVDIRFRGHPYGPLFLRKDKDGMKYPFWGWQGYLHDRRWDNHYF